jgi:hypothetical protein
MKNTIEALVKRIRSLEAREIEPSSGIIVIDGGDSTTAFYTGIIDGGVSDTEYYGFPIDGGTS